MRPTTETSLTTRERQILELIGQGKTSKELAAALGISIETIGNHRKSLCRKLNVHSTAELVQRAVLVGFRTHIGLQNLGKEHRQSSLYALALRNTHSPAAKFPCPSPHDYRRGLPLSFRRIPRGSLRRRLGTGCRSSQRYRAPVFWN